MNTTNTVIQNVGVGLRLPHVTDILATKPDIAWFELLIDNWFSKGGLNYDALDAIAEAYPIAFHGVNLSLGSVDVLNYDYLTQIKQLLARTGAKWYSEHCSFSSFAGKVSPDLLPLPYTQEALAHIVNKINQVQDFLGQKILIENVSCYVEHAYNDFSEAEFLALVAKQSGCDILLDVNNVYVNGYNHAFDPYDYIAQLPKDSIKEIHLGGHAQQDGFLLDTHGAEVAKPVWELYEFALAQFGDVATLIEWDNDLPALDVLLAERDKAQNIMNQQVINSKMSEYQQNSTQHNTTPKNTRQRDINQRNTVQNSGVADVA